MTLFFTAVFLFAYYYIYRGNTLPSAAEEANLKERLLYLGQSSAALLAVNFLGVFINIAVLSKYYIFAKHDATGIAKPALSEALNFAGESFAALCGFEGCRGLTNIESFRSSWALGLAVLLLLLLAAALQRFSGMRFEHKLVTSFAFTGFSANVLFCSMSGQCSYRYLLPSFVMLIPVAAIILGCLQESGRKSVSLALAAGLGVCLTAEVVCFCLNPYFEAHSDNAYGVPGHAYKEAADYLVRNGYSCGFATFWQSNIITEFSDGKIEMWTVYNVSERKKDVSLNPRRWLQDRFHGNFRKCRQGRSFCF